MFFFSKAFRPLLGPMAIGKSFPGFSEVDHLLAPHVKIKTGGALPSFPYAFMVYTGTTLPCDILFSFFSLDSDIFLRTLLSENLNRRFSFSLVN
jgi:hypothetical protein